MRYFVVVILSFVGLANVAFSLELDASTVLEYVEQGKTQEVLGLFYTNENLTLEEQRYFIFFLHH
ncbi:MAG: hypothetical protein HY860_01285 [Chlamydiales bacterium]|nr:hypothetical protein [Chlamydiales bacterium]